MHHTIAHRCPPAPADLRAATPRTAQPSRDVSGRSRLVWIAVLAAIVLGTAGPAATATRAQDESATPREEPMLDDPDSREPAAPRAPSAANAETQSLLDTLVEGGFIGLLIGLLSVAALGFIIEHSITIRKSVLMPEAVANELETFIQQGEIEAAIEACGDARNESLLADVVLAGLQRYRASEFGFAEYKAAVEEAGEDQTGRLYRKTEVLGVIGSVAPMLGLTGTVLGMIEAFNQIASTGGAARPDELAGGIGKALVTTLMGLIVAIPAMIAFSFFRNKIDSIVAETGKRVEQIMTPLGRRRST